MANCYTHVCGPVKGCWEDTAPSLPASKRLRKKDPEQDLGGQQITPQEALNRLVVRDAILQYHQAGSIARSAVRLVSRQFPY